MEDKVFVKKSFAIVNMQQLCSICCSVVRCGNILDTKWLHVTVNIHLLFSHVDDRNILQARIHLNEDFLISVLVATVGNCSSAVLQHKLESTHIVQVTAR